MESRLLYLSVLMYGSVFSQLFPLAYRCGRGRSNTIPPCCVFFVTVLHFFLGLDSFFFMLTQHEKVDQTSSPRHRLTSPLCRDRACSEESDCFSSVPTTTKSTCSSAEFPTKLKTELIQRDAKRHSDFLRFFLYKVFSCNVLLESL